MEDFELLQEYLEHGSEATFTEVVQRYTNMVFAVALRQTGNPEQAKDVTQAVFILLAHKARNFRSNVILPAWLFQTTRLVVAGLRKQETRRREREIKAATMSETCVPPENEKTPPWEEAIPLLDHSLSCLGEMDRKAVLLHFFQQRTHREVGLDLGLKEDAVRKRIGRALDKMRVILLKNGVTITVPALGACLTAQAEAAAPTGLAAATAALAMSHAPMTNECVSSLVANALESLFWNKVKSIAAWGSVAVVGIGLTAWLTAGESRSFVEYRGMSDASAALALDHGLFVVADDEENPLLVYARDSGGFPVGKFDFSPLFHTGKKNDEADWEGAARIGKRTYWITSHGQNRKGKDRPGRHRFFAADLQWKGMDPQLIPAGKVYTNLLADLIQAPQLTSFGLEVASKLAPKSPGALNIEGLCATPEGHLLIGFRNPVRQGGALLVPLLNPDELLEGRPAKLGEPIQLELNGQGIRDMTRVEDRYLIIAGPVGGNGESHLFEWLGPGHQPRPIPQLSLKGMTPEGLLVFPDLGLSRVLIISDDGARPVKGQQMKDQPLAQRSFRGLWISLSHLGKADVQPRVP